MMHIIWHGKGFLVVVITFGFSLTAQLICNSVTGSQIYWNTHKWPLAISLFVSALTCWLLGSFLRKHTSRVLLDPKTGKEVVLHRSDTLFFIPIIWWGPILAIFGLIALGKELLK
jgi:hypothetical protein